MKLTFKHISAACLLMGSAMAFAGCNDLDGDNSDFNFEDKVEVEGIERTPDTYRLATYNVHRCAPAGSSIANYDQTAKAIAIVDADVIALQELDNGTTTNKANQIEELAKRNGFKPYFCKAINSKGGEYGIGIMSRMEPVSTYSGALPGVEPRVFFVCEFTDFVYIATHLCVSKADNRTWSYDIINEYVQKNYADSPKPVFLAGDLNATSLPANCLANWEAISAATPTFYSSSSRIDYVLRWKGNSAPCKVVRTMVPVVEGFSFYNVSDHLPVLVDIEK